MHLAQHHFQAQSRYFEGLVSFTVSNLFFRPYGLVAIGLDAEALLNGTAALVHGRGVFPDGLVFNLGEDGVPAPLPIRELFSPTQDSHLLLLGIPAFQPTRSNCAEPNRNGLDARFLAAEEPVLDETTGEDEKKVGVARKNLRLLLDHQATEDLVTLPIGRIRRDGSGHFIYDPEYIPPTLRVGASARLVELLSRLVTILEAKADALMMERGSGSAIGERGTSEIASYWLSHAVHSSLAPLRHHLQSGEQHPEELYIELARLAGALCTFSLTSDPRMLPLYDHDRLDECFAALDRHIREHLEVIMPTNCIAIRLQRTDANLYAGSVLDKRCFDRAQWFLAVRSSLGAGELISRVPRLIKVCSAEVVKLVQRGQPGLSLEHVQVPPSAISKRAGAQYYGIARAGPSGDHPCWTFIVKTGQVGVYVPDAIPDVELEVIVVLDG